MISFLYNGIYLFSNKNCFALFSTQLFLVAGGARIFFRSSNQLYADPGNKPVAQYFWDSQKVCFVNLVSFLILDNYQRSHIRPFCSIWHQKCLQTGANRPSFSNVIQWQLKEVGFLHKLYIVYVCYQTKNWKFVFFFKKWFRKVFFYSQYIIISYFQKKHLSYVNCSHQGCVLFLSTVID